MEIHKILYIFLVFTIETKARDGEISPLCYGNSTDCSSLIENGSNICYMYRHPQCMDYKFYKWTNATLTNWTTEKDADFEVTIVAFKYEERPAYNVTITHSSAGIEGFFMKLVQLEINFTSCRIFDFRNLQVRLSHSFHMYYDCFIKLDYFGIRYHVLTIRALPNNKQLVYQINVPRIRNNEIDCNSETVIMALLNALHENRIAIKFQKLPSKLNISQYEVKLMRKDDSSFLKTKHLSANPTDDKKMISAIFESLDRGNYNLSVEPVHQEGRKCAVTYMSLSIPNKLPNYSYIGWLVGGIICVFLVSAVTYYVARKKQKLILKPLLRKILIVYHPDNNELLNLVHSFTAYLEVLIPAIVFVDCKLVNEYPPDWIITSFRSADIIMIILSDGIATGKIDMPAPPPYGSLFWQIYNHVYNEIIMNKESHSKIYLKVYFENYNCNNIPERLKLNVLGPNYELMKDFKKVFCCIKGISSFWSFLYQMPLPETTKEAIDLAVEELNHTNEKNSKTFQQSSK